MTAESFCEIFCNSFSDSLLNEQNNYTVHANKILPISKHYCKMNKKIAGRVILGLFDIQSNQKERCLFFFKAIYDCQ